jgi:hypothetical protein
MKENWWVTICMFALAGLCTGFLLLLWWPHSTHISNPAIMYVDETPTPWTPIHVLLRSAALFCLAGLWYFAIYSIVRLIRQRLRGSA